jgi:hypothetical protein
LTDCDRHRCLDVVDVIGHPAQQFTALAGVEIGQWKPVDFVLHLRAQCGDGALDYCVQQPGLRPDEKCGNQIHAQCQQQCAAYGGEVDPGSWDHVHTAQQIGKGAVTAGARRGHRLFLGDSGRQLPSDNPVEQQVRGVAEHPWADHR